MSQIYDFAMVCPQRSLSAELLLQELAGSLDFHARLHTPSSLIESPPEARNLVILNYSVQNPGTLKLVRLIEHNFPDYRVFLLLEQQSAAEHYADFTSLAGIAFQHQPFVMILDGLQCVAAGRRWLPRDVLSAMLDRRCQLRAPSCVEGLSNKESEVVKRLSEGLTNEAIAMVLGVSPNTVKTHLQSVYRKLGVSSRTEVLAKLYA